MREIKSKLFFKPRESKMIQSLIRMITGTIKLSLRHWQAMSQPRLGGAVVVEFKVLEWRAVHGVEQANGFCPAIGETDKGEMFDQVEGGIVEERQRAVDWASGRAIAATGDHFGLAALNAWIPDEIVEIGDSGGHSLAVFFAETGSVEMVVVG